VIDLFAVSIDRYIMVQRTNGKCW